MVCKQIMTNKEMIITFLVIWLGNTDLTTSFADGGTHGIPEILATAVTFLTYRWKSR
jgi:branched-subunit amino acid transport protein AzlD